MDLISSTKVYNYIATLIHNKKNTHTHTYIDQTCKSNKKNHIYLLLTD